MDSKQLNLRHISTKPERKIDTKIASKERSGLANASFRVYYSLRAGTVPFLWETKPGTPKSTAISPPPSAAAAVLPPISPPPSYHSSQLKGRRCRRPASWPAAGELLRALLGMLGLGKRRSRRSNSD